MQKNETHEIEIDGMTSEGQGVGRVDGFVVFVDGALPGEKVLTHIVKSTSSYAIGKIIDIMRPANTRRDAFCAAYERCGGCALQHMDYAATLDYKTGVVKDAIQRIAGLSAQETDEKVLPTIGMESPFNYRNKAQYPVGKDRTGATVSGFYAKRTHEIVPHENCAIQDATSGRVRERVMAFMARHPRELTPYDEHTGRGLIRHIMTRVGFATGDVMVVLVITTKQLPYAEELVADLVREIPNLKSVFLNINTSRTNLILGRTCIKLHGDDRIFDEILFEKPSDNAAEDFANKNAALRFRISPLSFFQVNPVQTQVLYSTAIELAALNGSETVNDLYCGTGTIGLFAARNAKHVIGIESVPEAIADARANALANGISNIEFHVGLAEEFLEGGVSGDDKNSDNVVFLDPPRKGCEPKLLESLVHLNPARIVYVSCNPATLARDLKILLAQNFQLVTVRPVDMFPWGSHVEVVTLLTRV